MKFCPQCKTGFHDHAETCPTHGGYLSEIIDLKPGMLIRGTYRIVRKLGEGGFGAVYLANQTLMDEPRAVKFLSRRWSMDQAFTARFRREVRTLRQLRHRNVVDCGDLERAEDDSLFFSMEFVDGPDLRAFLRQVSRPFDVTLALEITRGITEGLGAAHAKGIVHRDIKPENILLARAQGGYIPKIADFGVVATKESSYAHTRTGASLLTMAYAAPEQWLGMRAAELDGRTDLYALGGVLYEMLTGRTVFDADSYEGWGREHLHAVPRPPSELRPELLHWQGLDALIIRLLAKDREHRLKDVAELLGLLDAVRYGASGQRQRTVAEQPGARDATILERANPKPKRSSRGFRRWAWGAVAMLVLIAAGDAVWLRFLAVQPQPKPGPATTPAYKSDEVEFAGPDIPIPSAQGGTADRGKKMAPADPSSGWTISDSPPPGFKLVEPPVIVVSDGDFEGEGDTRPAPAHILRSAPSRSAKLSSSLDSEVVTRRQRGVFVDRRTGLMWTATENGADLNFEEASQYCTSLRLGGFDDWRLPTFNELQGIYDPSGRHPGDCEGATFPVRIVSGITLKCYSVWSTTQGHDVPIGQFDPSITTFYFYNGGAYDVFKNDKTRTRALCDRAD